MPFLIVFTFKKFFTFSFRNVLWPPKLIGIRTVDLLVSFKLQTLVFGVWKDFFSAAINIYCCRLELSGNRIVQIFPRMCSLIKLGELELRSKVLKPELTAALVLSFLKTNRSIVFPLKFVEIIIARILWRQWPVSKKTRHR